MSAYPANKELERVIRPIVEGQIRGFLLEHPKIVDAVDWYKPRSDKATTLVNSLTKRIVRDLACGTSAARLAAVLVEFGPASRSSSSVEPPTAAKRSWLARSLAKIVTANVGHET